MAIFFRPGQQLKNFQIERPGTHMDGRGRMSNVTEPEIIGTFLASIADASQREQYEWKQLEHPITHQIAQQGSSSAVAGDTLVMSGSPGRKFYIQGRTDPGELGIWTIYSVLEQKGAG